jgi:predicted NAD/FAD-dependent oxidoreductase
MIPLEDYQRLDVAIVGAGIAGLAAAIGLSRNGHNVEVNCHLTDCLSSRRTQQSFSRSLSGLDLGVRLALQCTSAQTPRGCL